VSSAKYGFTSPERAPDFAVEHLRIHAKTLTDVMPDMARVGAARKLLRVRRSSVSRVQIENPAPLQPFESQIDRFT
jgi:hypothetical protein